MYDILLGIIHSNLFFPILIVLGGIGFFKFFGGKSKSTKSVENALHMFKQNESVKKIESIENNQTKVIAEIKDHEDVSIKIQERIQKITNKAADDIEKIKKMSTIQDVDDYIDSNWSNL